ncbi:MULTISPECIES: hypothetical protein [unclassified Streptomyces]|uniref:hypothetical protein n=1 Tax=unclassified Streptomyces TaxID=2593676 RepID=UPI00332437AA
MGTWSAGAVSGVALRAIDRARPVRSVAAEVAAAGAVDEGAAAFLGTLTGTHLAPDAGRWREPHDAPAEHRSDLAELATAPPVPPTPDHPLRPPPPRVLVVG